jgi:pimeloyl-ACP methyl ester carboxylesterase
VFIFDYRYFGGSTDTSKSKIRNLVMPWYHIADTKIVIEAIESGVLGNKINEKSISLWGTSLAGGHALVIASELGPTRIKSVISHVPHLDGREASKKAISQRGILKTIRIIILSISDFILSHFLGLSPIYVKIVETFDGAPSYMMLTENDLKSYFSKHPKEYLGGWQNLAPARTMLLLSLYSPVDVLKKIDVPVLFVGATQDSLCPAKNVQEAAKIVKKAEYFEVNCTHFEIYVGDYFNAIVEEMVKFASKHK